MSASAARYDVAIVGAGMVGASLALALQDTPLKVLAIEAHPPDSAQQPSFDDRTTALGNGARRILDTLGVWREIAADAGAIRSIHVSDAGHFGFARLQAAEHGLEAFGYTVSNRQIGAVLWRILRARGRIELACPARLRAVQLEPDAAQLRIADAAGAERVVHASTGGGGRWCALAGAAGGRHRLQRRRLRTGGRGGQYPHRSCGERPRLRALRRVRADGAAAVAPRALHGGVGTRAGAAAAMQSCDARQFCEQLQHAFGWRAGRILEVGRRAGYRLELLRALEQSAPRVH